MKIDLTHSERSPLTSAITSTDREAKVRAFSKPLHDVVTINNTAGEAAATFAQAREGTSSLGGATSERVQQIKEAMRHNNYPVDLASLAQAILTKDLASE